MPFTSETASKAGKSSSRQGSPNKATSEIREHYKNLISDNLEQLKEDLKSLKPAERIDVIIKLSKYVIPTLKAVEMKGGNKVDMEPIIITFKDDWN